MYWCFTCVDIKRPFCQSGFVQEMGDCTSQQPRCDFGWELGLSLWALFLLGMTSNSPSRRRRLRREEFRKKMVDNDNEEAYQGPIGSPDDLFASAFGGE